MTNSNNAEAKRLMNEAKVHLQDAELCLTELKKSKAVLFRFGNKLSPMAVSDWNFRIEAWANKHTANIKEAELKAVMVSHLLAA